LCPLNISSNQGIMRSPVCILCHLETEEWLSNYDTIVHVAFYRLNEKSG